MSVVVKKNKTKQKHNIGLGKDTWNLVLEKHLAIPVSDTDWLTFAEPARQKTETTFNLFDTAQSSRASSSHRDALRGPCPGLACSYKLKSEPQNGFRGIVAINIPQLDFLRSLNLRWKIKMFSGSTVWTCSPVGLLSLDVCLFASSFTEVKKEMSPNHRGIQDSCSSARTAGSLGRTQIADQGKHTRGEVDKSRRGSTGAFMLPSFDFISADWPPPLSSMKRGDGLGRQLVEIFCVPKLEKALQTPTLWARGASRPGRQRTRAEVEEEGWKDGWRKKLHRGGHLITASDVNINRSEDEAACRCERWYTPTPQARKKQPCKKEGKKKPERTEGSRDTVTHFDSTSNKTVWLTHTGDHHAFFFHLPQISIHNSLEEQLDGNSTLLQEHRMWLGMNDCVLTPQLVQERCGPPENRGWRETALFPKGMCWWETNVCRVRWKYPASCRAAPPAQLICGHGRGHSNIHGEQE